MASLVWNNDILCAQENVSEEIVFKWTYSVFEEVHQEAVTPSMYEFMASYVEQHMTKERMKNFPAVDYRPGDVEYEAIEAYYNIPVLDRIDMHEQMLVNLTREAQIADEKMHAYIDALLDDECHFDTESPIYEEYNEWLKERKKFWEDRHESALAAIHEEEVWRYIVGDPLEY